MDIDITDPDVYVRGIPHEVFRHMRDTEPIAERMYEGRPYWAVTRYEDLVTVTRVRPHKSARPRWVRFSSAKESLQP